MLLSPLFQVPSTRFPLRQGCLRSYPNPLSLQTVLAALPPCSVESQRSPSGTGSPSPLHSQGYSDNQLLVGTQVLAQSISPRSTDTCPFPAQQTSFGSTTCLSSICASSLHLEKAVSQDKVLPLESKKMQSTLVRSVGRSGQYRLSGTVGVWKR